jgi:hypothetical protein
MFMMAGVAVADVPRPEHPRPDLCRENWMTLNGEWQFEIDKAATGEARGLTHGKDLNAKIIVPFCPESKLSGIGLGNTQKLKDVWYRRTFELPSTMQGKRVRIHFGAVDFKAWVYINGKLAGAHVGESSAFSFEITKLLREGGNEVVVKVLDDLWSGLQPGGKQAPEQSGGCLYTRTTGIWQPVWLEAVGSSFVENISIVPDPDNSRVLVTAKINGKDKNLKLTVEAFADGKLVGSDTAAGPWQNQLVVNLKQKKLWAPGTPFLYDLKFTLSSGKETIDELTSYFGLRSVSIDGRKILINGKPVFQRLILDQGFYPEGLWTAPTDEALKKDIELSMACGYNGARLHQKVFEPRFLYWADKLGYLVWGESPNWGFSFKPEGYAGYINEWTEILLRDRNHPSIIGWCAFNETDGKVAGELQQLMWNLTKAIDPTRPALETSGWVHTLPNPEVWDAHDYDGNPATFRERWMGNLSVTSADRSMPARYRSLKLPRSGSDRGIPFMVSEIGGIGWAIEGGFGYGPVPKALDEFYSRYKGTIDAMLDNPHLFGFCYTQLTDIEQERNGLYYYDRKPKFDVKKLHDITSREAAYEQDPGKPVTQAVEPKWNVLVGALQDGALSTPYKYVTEKPADDWAREVFDDHAWKTGLAPFGREQKRTIKTEWTTPDIYLRKTFDYDGSDLKQGAVVICHDEDTEVYVNGQKILDVNGFISSYMPHTVTDQLKKALKRGVNTIAVHTHQTQGGQYIDLAILVEGIPKMPVLKPLFDYPVRDTSVCFGPDGMYYLTGTTGHPTWWHTNEGIRMWKSRDLKTWEPLGLVWSFEKNATWQKGQSDKDGKIEKRAIWAPELHYFKGTYWLAYCVNYDKGGTGILKSESGKPEGPYVDVKKDGPVTGEIDASLFADDDGTIYLVWQNGKIAKMKDDMSGLAEEPRHLKPANSGQVGFEAASIAKINGRYHLLCADWGNWDGKTKTYDCMAASAENIYGPYGDRYLAIPCGGHNVLFKDVKGEWWSTYFGNDDKAPFKERPAILSVEIGSDNIIKPVAD